MTYQEDRERALGMVERGADWKGLERWVCSECPWDSLNGEEAAVQHALQEHLGYSPEAAAQVEEPETDRFGNELPELTEVAGEDFEIDLSALKVDDVMDLAREGQLDVEATIEAEREGQNRVTLIRQLEELSETDEEG